MRKGAEKGNLSQKTEKAIASLQVFLYPPPRLREFPHLFPFSCLPRMVRYRPVTHATLKGWTFQAQPSGGLSMLNPLGGGCYPPRPSALLDNILLVLPNYSHPIQPHSIVAYYLAAHTLKAQYSGRQFLRSFTIYFSKVFIYRV